MRWAPQRFNDSLALLLVLLTFSLWAYLIVGRVPLDGVGVIVGATINTVGLVATFYFRKSPPPDLKP